MLHEVPMFHATSMVVPPSCDGRLRITGPTSLQWLHGVEAKREATLPLQTSSASCTFFLRCPPLLTSVHCLCEGSFYFLFLLPFSILEFLLLLSGQCPNPDPAYLCPVCHKPYTTKHHSFQCSLCKAWANFKCSGLPRAGDYHTNWWCPA